MCKKQGATSARRNATARQAGRGRATRRPHRLRCKTRGFVVEKRTRKRRGGGFRTLPESSWTERRCPDPKALRVKVDVQVQQNSSSLKGSGSVLSGEWLEGDQFSGSSSGGSQNKRKAVVRKESADTQECVVSAERHECGTWKRTWGS